jgi:hypothetical protein
MDDTRAAVKFVTCATVKAVVLKAPAAIATKLSDDPPASTNTAQHHHQYRSTLQRCDNKQCLAALETRPYLQVRQMRQLWQISEIFCIYYN